MTKEKDLNQKTKSKKPTLLSGFWDFMKEYYVIGLAIGVVTGQAVNGFINSLVINLISPLIALFLPDQSIANLQFTIRESHFNLGDIINTGINLVIVLFLIYILIKVVLRKEDLLKKKK